jgi:Putative DNA-binding domain
VPARPDLKSIQNEVAASLLNSGRAADVARVSKLIKGGKLSPEQRIEIYRRNVFSTLTGALSDLYPVTEKIVSTSFFLRLAEQFVCVTPSASGDLNMFGSEWPEFLRRHTEAINLPYLEDVAKLEWAWHQAFHAGDCMALDMARLADVPPEQHAALRFHLHPSVMFIESAHPIVRIWEVNQNEYAGDMRVDWTLPGDLTLVSREDLAVKIQSLPRANFDFLRALSNGETLATAADMAFAADAEFALQHALLSAIQSNLIVDLNPNASKVGDSRIND